MNDLSSFIDWLSQENKKRGWTQADLARAANVSRTAINDVFNLKRKSGPELCTAIAHAFNFPPEVVFRKAGLLPPVGEEPPDLLELKHLYMGLPDDVKEDVLGYVRYKAGDKR